MTMTQSVDPLRAATAERLERMFRLAVAHADERDDLTRAIEALANIKALELHTELLRPVLERLENAEVTTLTHEERVALYVASKALKGKQQP